MLCKFRMMNYGSRLFVFFIPSDCEMTHVRSLQIIFFFSTVTIKSKILQFLKLFYFLLQPIIPHHRRNNKIMLGVKKRENKPLCCAVNTFWLMRQGSSANILILSTANNKWSPVSQRCLPAQEGFARRSVETRPWIIPARTKRRPLTSAPFSTNVGTGAWKKNSLGFSSGTKCTKCKKA